MQTIKKIQSASRSFLLFSPFILREFSTFFFHLEGALGDSPALETSNGGVLNQDASQEDANYSSVGNRRVFSRFSSTEARYTRRGSKDEGGQSGRKTTEWDRREAESSLTKTDGNTRKSPPQMEVAGRGEKVKWNKDGRQTEAGWCPFGLKRGEALDCFQGRVIPCRGCVRCQERLARMKLEGRTWDSLDWTSVKDWTSLRPGRNGMSHCCASLLKEALRPLRNIWAALLQ